MKNFLPLLLLVLITFDSNAEDITWTAGTILGSEHYGGNYNEDQTGSIYICITVWCVGMYENSYYEDSIFISRHWTIGRWKALEFGADVGIVSGYEGYITDNEITPFAALSVKVFIFKILQIGSVTGLALEITSEDWRKLND